MVKPTRVPSARSAQPWVGFLNDELLPLLPFGLVTSASSSELVSRSRGARLGTLGS